MQVLQNPNSLPAQNYGPCPGSFNDDKPLPVTPVIFTKEAAYLLCPALKDLQVVAMEINAEAKSDPDFEGDQVGETTCVLAGSVNLSPLLPVVNPSRAALVMFLPSEMEASLSKAVVQDPCSINITTTDHLQCSTFAMWTFGVAGIEKSICLWEEVLSILANGYHELRDGAGQAHDNAYELPYEWWAEVVPVVMVAGESVAVGGFWATELNVQGNYASSSSGINWKPYRIHSNECMEAAALEAERIGNKPWYLQFDESGSEWQITVPVTFSCRD